MALIFYLLYNVVGVSFFVGCRSSTLTGHFFIYIFFWYQYQNCENHSNILLSCLFFYPCATNIGITNISKLFRRSCWHCVLWYTFNSTPKKNSWMYVSDYNYWNVTARFDECKVEVYHTTNMQLFKRKKVINPSFAQLAFVTSKQQWWYSYFHSFWHIYVIFNFNVTSVIVKLSL